jgi:hypothetical protein
MSIRAVAQSVGEVLPKVGAGNPILGDYAECILGHLNMLSTKRFLAKNPEAKVRTGMRLSDGKQFIHNGELPQNLYPMATYGLDSYHGPEWTDNVALWTLNRDRF